MSDDEIQDAEDIASFVFDTSLDHDSTEFRIHRAIADFLSGQIRHGNKITQGTPPFPGMLVTHCYQGRNKDEGFFLKMLGVKAGISDLLCWYRKPSGGYGCSFLEVKKPGGYLSAPQKKIKGWCHWLGVPYAVVHSEKEAFEHFIAQGLKPVHSAYKNTDTRTLSEKKQAAFDAQKPVSGDDLPMPATFTKKDLQF